MHRRSKCLCHRPFPDLTAHRNAGFHFQSLQCKDPLLASRHRPRSLIRWKGGGAARKSRKTHFLPFLGGSANGPRMPESTCLPVFAKKGPFLSHFLCGVFIEDGGTGFILTAIKDSPGRPLTARDSQNVLHPHCLCFHAPCRIPSSPCPGQLINCMRMTFPM